MSMLSKASAPAREPMIATIVGGPGVGKTSLAATFPAPIIIRTPGEAIPRDVPGSPVSLQISNSRELWEVLMELVNEDHTFQTLVVDSATGLDQMFTADILESDPKARGINQALGGYGAGPAAVSAMHGRVRKAAEALRNKRGMNTLFLAHADIARIDPPDTDGYSQYTLRLPGKSVAPYVDNVDLVGFLKQQTILKGDEGNKKAVATDDRILVTYLTPANVSKNRYGIRDDIDVVMGENPLAAYLAESKPVSKRVKSQEPADKIKEEGE